jgi:hypothetical protein
VTVRWELAVRVLVPEGGEPTEVERSLAEHIRWVNQLGPYTSAYHEVMAHIAGMVLRDHWAQADLYAGLERKREQRLPQAAARRAERDTP